jgi:hypothetical protein
MLQVVELRDVPAPGAPHPESGFEGWVPLADAMAAGIDLSYVTDGIGPRVRGMVYRGGYLRNVSTVHNVFVCVAPADRDPETGRPRPRRAVWWDVAEESADDDGRVRRHMTSWQYDRDNRPLFMALNVG